MTTTRSIFIAGAAGAAAASAAAALSRLGAPDAAVIVAAPLLGAVGGAAADWWRGKGLDELAMAMGALARREHYVSVPFVDAAGSEGAVARSALELRTAVAEAEALAAEQKAERDQQRLSRMARDMFVDQFQTAATTVLSEMIRAAEELRGMGERMLSQADEAMQQGAASAMASEQTAASVATVAGRSGELAGAVAEIHAQVQTALAAARTAGDEVRAADASVVALADAADHIHKVLEIINAVAGQTRMLALNATIEAERAGESGQGFRVVASEIKDLAAKTRDATADIGADVSAMTGALQRSVAAMRAIAEDIDAVETAAGAVADVAHAKADAIAGISASVGEAALGVDEAAARVSAAASATEQSRALLDDLIGSAANLDARSSALWNATSAFLTNIRGGSIRVGVLHSLSGAMGAAEQPLKDLMVMLAERTNRAGGLLGRPLELAIVNPRSDWDLYPEMTRRLIEDEKVAVIFGCWTSVSRKQVLPVVEKLDGLLMYPVQYEGQEQSPNIFYTGATPNQQAIPAVDWLLSPEGGAKRRFVLAGTDYIYPRTTNDILAAHLKAKGVAASDILVDFTPFSHEQFDELAKKIKRFAQGGPTAVVSTINGDANVHFYRALKRQGVAAADAPVMAFSVGENEAATMGRGLLDGHYIAWNYLMTMEAQQNRAFIEEWRSFRQDPAAVVDDPMESAWIGFHLWRDAVLKAGDPAPAAVRRALGGLSLTGLSGATVRMDPELHHVHKPAVIGKIGPDGAVRPVWRSDGVLPPAPWSPYLRR